MLYIVLCKPGYGVGKAVAILVQKGSLHDKLQSCDEKTMLMHG